MDGTIWRATVLAAALAFMAAVPARAELREFTCTPATLGTWVTDSSATFLKSAQTPYSSTFAGQVHVRRPGAAAPVTVSTDCSFKFDLDHFGDGGRISPIHGQYRLLLQCVATPAGGSGRSGMETRLSVAAPARGGPFDDPAAKARFEDAACRAARHAIFAASMGR